MKNSIVKILTFVGCALLVAGCGDKGGGTSAKAPRKATEPRGALENMQLTILAGDKKAFVDCFEAAEKEKYLLGAFCEYVIAMSQFDQAMRKAYGEEGIKETTRGRDPAMNFNSENWLNEVSIKVEGDKASIVTKGGGETWQLVRKDGLWKIRAENMLGLRKDTSDENIEQATKMYQAMAKAVNDVKQKIGQPGYTAEKVNKEFVWAMVKASGGPSIPSYIPK